MPVNEALLNGPVFGNFYVKEATAIVFAFLMGVIPVTAIAAWLVSDMDRASVKAGLNGPFAVLRLAAYVIGAVAFGAEVAIGLVPVAIVAHGGGIAFGFFSGVAVVLGHACSPWRKYGRGDEYAVALGATLAVCWPAGLIFAAVGAVGAASSGYAVAGKLIAAAFAFLPLWYFAGVPGAAFGLAVSLIVAWGLRARFVRWGEGREPRLRLFGRAQRQLVERRDVEDRERPAAARADDAALLQIQ